MKTPMILIHGTWGSEKSWQYMKEDFEKMGFDLIIPSLRYHDLPYKEAEKKVGSVSLSDYADDIISLVKECDTPPLLVGHSLGCLIAQIVSERVAVKGLVLLGPAPTADIFQLYPSMIRSFYKHFLRWNFWKTPMPPYKEAQYNIAMSKQDLELKHTVFEDAVPESGKVYTEMAFPQLDPGQSNWIDFEKIECPVLIITGENDKMTVPAIAQKTAENYGNQATIYMVGDADHYYIAGKYKDQVISLIKKWLKQRNFM